MQTPTKRGRRAAHVLLLLGSGLSPAAFAAISGTVFQDFNSNGQRDLGGVAAAVDRGIGGVSVRAYDVSGACGVAATTSSVPASLGSFTLNVTGCSAAAPLRVEFTGYPAGLQPSFHSRASSGAPVATRGGTTVQFVADGANNVEVGLNAPVEFCQDDPLVAVAEQAFGDPQAAANASIDAVVRFPYSLTGSVGTPQPTGPVGIAGVPEVGTVYGMAYDKLQDNLFIAAYHKRHAGFGPGGTGTIYRVNAASSGAPAAPASFVDLNAVFGPATTGTDTVRGNYEGGAGGDTTWDQVGKSAYGDLELSLDGASLFAVNMADRQLYTIPTSGALNTTTITRRPIPSPCTTAADARPFGLAMRGTTLYVSGVCSAQSTQLAADLRAWVYAYDTVAGTFGATPVLQFALNYPRAAGNSDAVNDPSGDAIWRAWSSVAGTPAATNNSVYAEPMFSDLTFDGPDLVLGLRDRHGDHTGTGNVGTIRGITAGEILRACANGAGGWNLEQEGSCGGVTGAAGTATNQARGPNSAGNTRGGEFYPLDHYSDTSPPFFINDTPPDYNGRHDENAQGALIQVPGYATVASTIMDPFRFNSGGLRWYSNLTPADPASSRGYEIFQTGSGGFSKANGLGDADALCRAAPVEVGNYVWNDSNHNGVMDPGEAPIANVVLNLYSSSGAVLGSATTDANGEYYFVFSQGAADASTTDNLIVAPNPYFSTYTIGIVPANFSAGGALVNLRATVANTGGGGVADLRDSDGVAVTIPASTTTLGAAFTLAGAGDNNHSIDFGFGSFDYGDLPDTAAGNGSGNYNTLAADNGAAHGIVPGLFLGATVDAEADGQPNAAASGDDSNGTPDDEDGVTVADLALRVGRAPAVRVNATNTSGAAAQLCGFIDYNGDGDFADAGESANLGVPNGSNNAAFTLNFGVVPAGSATASYARFRLSTDAGCSASGIATNGEVEDYTATIAALDFGDLPDAAAGTGTGNYNTREADSGASHVIVGGLFLGAGVDAEGDGQPNAAASGDDTTGTPDDEDGVTIADLSMVSGTSASVRVNASNSGAAARLCGFVDFNGDGDFADAGESATQPVAAGASNATVTLNFGTVPANAAASTYARFRLDRGAGACSATGPASEGEVEDYPVSIGQLDFGDLPDTGAGNGPGNYATLLADNGPRHPIVAGLRLGANEDGEADGQPSTGANGDDASGTPDDEDGVVVGDLSLIAGTVARVRTAATNTLAVPAQLCGFVDFNGDGDFADAGETAPAVTVPVGSNAAPFTLDFGIVPSNAARNTYARFRLSTSTAACTPVGLAPDGEVEDNPIAIAATDFGDLPDTGAGNGAGNYSTLLSDDGARHSIVPGLFLGAGVDAEADGQPGTSANNDDANGTPDDEDGVNTADLALQRGVAPAVRVTGSNSTGSAATICGFIDYNGDGAFSAPGETAQGSLPNGSSNALVTLNFGSVPNNAVAASYARFRVSTAGTCSPSGAAIDGEVEDYPVNIGAGVLSLGNLVWNDRNNNGQVDAGEAGLPAVAVALYQDSNNDGTPDGAALANTSTDTNGNYLFQNLDPDSYIVEIVPPAGYLGSSCSGFPYATSGTCEPAADPDNDADNDDNGTLGGAVIRSGTVTLTVGGEPTNDGDGSNGNLSVDFGLLGNFDLALTKRLTAGQTGPFIAGQDVSFDITVINQGGIAAQNILVNDYIPAGLALSPAETNWTSVSPTLATRTIAGPLAAGASTSVTILLRVQPAAGSPLVNRAEIGGADDDGDASNTPPTDIDSTPDSNPGNDAGGTPNTPSDDATGGNGSGTPGDGDANGDEDDADPASIGTGSGSAVLGVAKAAQVLSVTGGGGYGSGAAPGNADVAYVLTVRNYSSQPVDTLQVTENLVATFGAAANWSVTGVTAPSLTLNPAFDGRSVTNLLAGTDTLAAGATTTIRLSVNIRFEPGRTYSNQVTASGSVGGVPVSDLSHNGVNPAPSGDPGSDSEPTVITLGSTAVPALSAPMVALLIGVLAFAGLRRRRSSSVM